MSPSRTLRRLSLAAALLAAPPALAYIPPASTILKAMGERRAAAGVEVLEVNGTLEAQGAAAEKLPSTLTRTPAGTVSVPARFLMKVPGRCRLELAPPGVAEADRPFVSLRDGKLSAKGGLDGIPAATALLRAACTFLATSTAGDASGTYAAALGRRGVRVADVTLGRFDGKLAWVLGGREKEPHPLAFIEKTEKLAGQPMRLVATEGGALLDTRFLGWGAPTGGDWFPRAAEVWQADALLLRLTTEKATGSAKLADTLF
ncbi:MAG: hypothetical protein QM767_27145 [Anaeromyxobacter sp.]